jgi:hypothetical protein
MKALLQLFLCALLFSACGRGHSDYELDETNFDAKTLQMIQSDSRITLPKGARGLNFYYKAPIDPAYAAKIEIPQSSKESIMRTLSAIKDETISVTNPLGPRMRWWFSKDAKILADRQATIGGNYLQMTLTDEGASVILYVEWVTI